MERQKLNNNRLMRFCFFITRPSMLLVSAVVIILLYGTVPLFGFFALFVIAFSCIARGMTTPSGQFFTPRRYNDLDNTGFSDEPPLQAVGKNMGKAQMAPSRKKLNADNHEKITDSWERERIKNKFNEIISNY